MLISSNVVSSCVVCTQHLPDNKSFNAQPVTEGRCCAKCYYVVVIPAMDAIIRSYTRRPL
jgi:hypothetical protein